jgi:hypothetical protein
MIIRTLTYFNNVIYCCAFIHYILYTYDSSFMLGAKLIVDGGCDFTILFAFHPTKQDCQCYQYYYLIN